MTRRSGFGSQRQHTANARSGLVYVVHPAEKKVGAPMGHTVALLRHWMPSRSASHRPL